MSNESKSDNAFFSSEQMHVKHFTLCYLWDVTKSKSICLPPKHVIVFASPAPEKIGIPVSFLEMIWSHRYYTTKQRTVGGPEI